MKTLLKSLLYLVLTLVILVAAVLIYLTQFFDANSYKPLIMEQAEKAGVPLELNGDLDVSVYPWLGARIEGVKVLDPQQRDPEQPFARINEAGIKLKVMPLLSGSVEVDRIILDGLYADIVIDEQGRGNWEVFIPKNDSASQNTPGSVPQGSDQEQTSPQLPSERTAGSPLALAVAGIDITNTRLNFTDRRQNLSAQIEQLELHSDSITLKQHFPLSLKAALVTRNPDLKTSLDLNSRLYLDLEQQDYRLNDLVLNLQAQTPLIGPSPVKLSLKTDVVADMQTRNIRISDLAFQLRELLLQAEGLPEASANLDLNAPGIALDLAQQQYQAEQLSLKLFARTPAMGPEPFTLELLTAGQADLGRQTAELKPSQLKLNDITVTLQAVVQQLLDNPSVEGAIRIDEFAPRALLRQLQISLPEMADPETLQRFSLVSRLQLKDQQARIHDLKVVADDSTLTGEAGMNLTSQAMFADLALDRINLDRYLPPEPAEPVESDKPAEPAPDSPVQEETDLIPVEALKPLQADVRMTVAQLQVKKHPVTDVLLDLDADKGLIKLNAANLALYQGQVQNTATLDLNQTPIRMSVSHKTRGLEIKPLLVTASEFDGFEGSTFLQADMTASTNRMSTLMASLNGQASFNILKGAFNRINIPKEICFAAGGEVQVAQWSPNTDFTSMKGDIRFTNGIGNNQNLTVAIPGITITGFGLVNLPDSEFTYNIGANITNANDKVCKVKSNLKAIRWPAECKGRYGNQLDFGCAFDVKAIGEAFKDIAKKEAQAALKKEEARLKAKLEAEQKRVEEKARKELERALQKLF